MGHPRYGIFWHVYLGYVKSTYIYISRYIYWVYVTWVCRSWVYVSQICMFFLQLRILTIMYTQDTYTQLIHIQDMQPKGPKIYAK
jgi:hypothetical protein